MERGEPGVITTHKRKELYSNTAVERFASSGVWYASQFICVNPYGDANARAARVKRMFRKQMGIFSKIVIPRANNHSKPKIIYSGKDQGNDDLVLTFMIALYWSIQFMTGRSNPSAKDIL